jgi:glutaredoxin
MAKSQHNIFFMEHVPLKSATTYPRDFASMSRICPNCKYLRKPSDTAPDWQCPSCHIAYNKGAGANTGEQYGRYRTEHEHRPASGIAKWLVVITILIAGGWFGKPVWQSLGGETTTRLRNQPAVTLYATTWCGYCAATRRFFADNGIQYTELDVEESTAGYEGHRRLGGNGVPLGVVGDEVIRGFNETELRARLKPWLKKS